ncbi:ribonuclease P protein component [Alloactinosynnema sp. L-07]|uniref:ribonuclease P protein component n=1 Tax=Alloactinosynnema sp. L-07 TaxID=1653480 RepID=UPI0006B47F67|nr:ribonuclease P protein component [Alloactinosynnema sp. L-07]
MLPAAARLTSSADFQRVTRKGRRAGRPRLVVHAVTEWKQATTEADPRATWITVSPRVGFVVSKAVGNAVVRHRVTRRLRHLAMARLGTLRPGTTLVVRALPPAAAATSAELGQDLDAAFRRLHLAVDDNGGEA